MINGVFPDDTSAWALSRSRPAATDTGAASNDLSAGELANGLVVEAFGLGTALPRGGLLRSHSCNSPWLETVCSSVKSHGKMARNQGTELMSVTCSTPMIKCPPAFNQDSKA